MDIKSIRQRFAVNAKMDSADTPTSITEKQLSDWAEAFDARDGHWITAMDSPIVAMHSIPLSEVIERPNAIHVHRTNANLRPFLSGIGYGPEYHLEVKADMDTPYRCFLADSPL